MSIIELNNVCLSYPNGVEAVKNVSLFFDKGEFVYLMGSTGSGKSSVLKLIYREEIPTSGEIYINNHDITDLPRRKVPFLRRKIGVIFQDFKLLDYKTAAENVAYALEVTGFDPNGINEQVDKVLDVVGLLDKKDRYPEQLSGGEKQLTSIARAISHNPPVLLADEPTGNLDSDSAWNIINILDRISMRGTTVVVATHDRSIVERMKKRIVVIQNGGIISDQKPPALSTEPPKDFNEPEKRSDERIITTEN